MYRVYFIQMQYILWWFWDQPLGERADSDISTIMPHLQISIIIYVTLKWTFSTKSKPLGNHMVGWIFLVQLDTPTMIGCTIVSGCTGNQMLRRVTHLSTILALRGSTFEFAWDPWFKPPWSLYLSQIIGGGSPWYVNLPRSITMWCWLYRRAGNRSWCGEACEWGGAVCSCKSSTLGSLGLVIGKNLITCFSNLAIQIGVKYVSIAL